MTKAELTRLARVAEHRRINEGKAIKNRMLAIAAVLAGIPLLLALAPFVLGEHPALAVLAGMTSILLCLTVMCADAHRLWRSNPRPSRVFLGPPGLGLLIGNIAMLSMGVALY